MNHKRGSIAACFLVFLGAAIVLGSCASAPQKAAQDECLVVIKTEIINPDGLQMGRDWVLNYSGGYPSSHLGDFNGAFMTVIIKSDSITTVSIGTEVRSGYTGPKAEYKFVAPLPYDPGKITIADFVITDTLSRSSTSPNGHVSSIGARKITSMERSDLMSEISQDSSFASWSAPQQ